MSRHTWPRGLVNLDLLIVLLGEVPEGVGVVVFRVHVLRSGFRVWGLGLELRVEG